jgi:tetratricopeptide (TPR) repeat protein
MVAVILLCRWSPLFSQLNSNTGNTDSYEKIKIPTKNSSYQQKKGGYYDSKELQVQKEDNLNKDEGPDKVTIMEVDAFLDSATRVSSSNPGKAYDYMEKALSASISGKYMEGEILSYRMLGMINYDLRVFDIAETNYNKAIKLTSGSGLEMKYADLFNLNGMALREQGRNDEALKNFMAYLEFVSKSGDEDAVITAKSNIGSVLALQKKYSEAMQQYTYVFEAEKKRNNRDGIISSARKLGGLYLGLNLPNDALRFYQQALKLAQEKGDTRLVNDLTDDMSEVYRQQKRVQDELSLRQYAQKFSESQNDVYFSNQQNLKIADIYLNTNRTRDALSYLNTTANTVIDPREDPVVTTDILKERSEAFKTLSEVYVKQGDYQRALENYKNYMASLDSIEKKKQQSILEEKQVSDELFRKQLKIDMLEKEKDLGQRTIELLRKDDDLKEQHMTNQQLLIYAMGGGILAVILTTFLVYRSSRQKKVASELLALQGLRSQMNPHFIFNALNSVNHYIAGNDERKANKYLSDFSRLMRSVMENSQKDFIPLSAEIEILELYLRLEHARFSDKFEYHFHVDEEIDREQFLVPPMLIQPYIENAVWHGLRYLDHKGTLTVNITKEGNGLSILVEDNGIGRKRSREQKTPNQLKNRSTGMRNTENRLQLINSVFHTAISVKVNDANADGTGTRVEIHIPGPQKK